MTVRENAVMQADSILCAMSDRQKRTVALRHTYGVAALCAMLAAKRGLDVQLCELMGFMHDLYTFKTGHKNNHSYNGADMARIMLKRAGMEETQYTIIANALYNHSAKAYVHDAYSELLTVAEGNYGGTNRSAITKRPIDAHIAGILRIPDGYTYDFLSHNFMTGERVEPMRL